MAPRCPLGEIHTPWHSAKARPLPTSSASPLSPPALTLFCRLCAPPAPGLCTCSLSWGICLSSPSPAARPSLLLTRPCHFPLHACLPARAQHTSSGPEPRAGICTITAAPGPSSTALRGFEFAPHSVSVQTRGGEQNPACLCPRPGGSAVAERDQASPLPVAFSSGDTLFESLFCARGDGKYLTLVVTSNPSQRSFETAPNVSHCTEAGTVQRKNESLPAATPTRRCKFRPNQRPDGGPSAVTFFCRGPKSPVPWWTALT